MTGKKPFAAGEDSMPGLFITFEGIDLCGKTTQAERLVSHLRERGLDVIFTREPGGSAISEKIREILLNPEHQAMTSLTELLLYEASRAQHTDELIRPALDQGKVVICDRYADASYAYQGFGRSLGGELVRQLNQGATGGLVPDLTIVLDLPPEEAILRAEGKDWKADRLEGEKIDFHRRVRQGYLHLAEEEPARVRIIDGRGTIEQIQETVRSLVDPLLRKPLARVQNTTGKDVNAR
jgi:dTMP kinase